jgi:hypothetical protein
MRGRLKGIVAAPCSETVSVALQFGLFRSLGAQTIQSEHFGESVEKINEL